MPTVLSFRGWRLFFYANEGNEPIHIHCRKENMECKYWIDPHGAHPQVAYSYGLGPRDHREIRTIILENLDLIVTAWNSFQQTRWEER